MYDQQAARPPSPSHLTRIIQKYALAVAGQASDGLLILPAPAVQFLKQIEHIRHRQTPGLGQQSRPPHIHGICNRSSLHIIMLAVLSSYSCAGFQKDAEPLQGHSLQWARTAQSPRPCHIPSAFLLPSCRAIVVEFFGSD
jgi:hypothetical protein